MLSVFGQHQYSDARVKRIEEYSYYTLYLYNVCLFVIVEGFITK